MSAAFTITAGCVGCGNCLLTCPAHAIRPAGRARTDGGGEGRAAPLIVLSTCTGCGECGEVCPADACVPVPGTGGAG